MAQEAQHMKCIFCKIRDKEIPADRIFENEKIFAFLDIAPINKGHVLIVPKAHSETIIDADDSDLAAMMIASKKITKAIMKATNASGLNVGINNFRSSGQIVAHVHLHLIPRHDGDGFKHWPHKKYDEGEALRWAKKIKEAL